MRGIDGSMGGTHRAISHYQLVSKLGSGSMGDVYRAIDRRSGVTVAIKIMKPHLQTDPTYLDRFRREAHVASSLSSPYTVRVLDSGSDQGQYFMAMEFVDGIRLSDILRQQRLSALESLAITAQVALALDEAERRGVAHRDIKPDNILVSREQLIKVTDFGVARMAYAANLTMAGIFVGTAEYAAPEQQRGEADSRSDIYALGITLFQMLTGSLPFQADSLPSLLRQHEHTPPPLEALTGVAPPIIQIVACCLEKDPAKRYQRPVELLAAIEQARRAFTESEGWVGETTAKLIDTGDRFPPATPPSPPPASLPSGRGPPFARSGYPGSGPMVFLATGVALVVVVLVVALTRGSSDAPPTRVASIEGTPTHLVIVPGPAVSPPAPIQPTNVRISPTLAPLAPVQPTIGRTSPTLTPPAPPILLIDDFDDPNRGILATELSESEQYAQDYDRGEYVILIVDPRFQGMPFASVPGIYRDATITVDARLAGSAAGQYVALGCRTDRGAGRNSAYVLGVDPARRRFTLIRRDDGKETTLIGWESSVALHGNNASNRLELSCVQSLISASINDTPVASFQDSTYVSGEMWIGAGSFPNSLATVEARFDNLTVRGDPNDAPRPPPSPSNPRLTPTMRPAATVAPALRDLLVDRFDDARIGILTTVSSAPTRYTAGYVAGEYVLRQIDPEYDRLLSASLLDPNSPKVRAMRGQRIAAVDIFNDTVLSVDAYLVGDPDGRYIVLGCRSQEGSGSHYRVSVDPTRQEFMLGRWDGPNLTKLVDWTVSPAIQPDNATNRIQLGCLGSTISVGINGTLVASESDETYREGRLWIATGMLADVYGTAEAHFDNLVVLGP